MAALVPCGRRLFVPAMHIWYRPLRHKVQEGARKRNLDPAHTWIVQIGITDRGLDDIGDVSSVKPAITDAIRLGTELKTGDDLVNIEWDGHVITAADELYHTVWETVSGVKTIQSPVEGKILNVFHGDRGINEDDIICEVSTREESLQSAIQNLVDETEYNRLVEQIMPGNFSEAGDSIR
mmetsp:Transcript_23529/g.33003  ORF Transcript_23529/g.33003 Transcript_23529/m.33003 type:complete len:180 (-) Transcript_23529:240-779(-)